MIDTYWYSTYILCRLTKKYLHVILPAFLFKEGRLGAFQRLFDVFFKAYKTFDKRRSKAFETSLIILRIYESHPSQQNVITDDLTSYKFVHYQLCPWKKCIQRIDSKSLGYINQRINWLTYQHIINRSVDLFSADRSINQPIYPSVNQSVNQSKRISYQEYTTGGKKMK
jgi:hypothetical protein